MAQPGVYPLDYDMYYTIEEAYYGVSNRDILYNCVNGPLEEIRKGIRNGGCHPFILRERHRSWVEYSEGVLGVALPVSWEELVEEAESEYGDDYLFELLYSDAAEWSIFGDDVDIEYKVLAALPDRVLTSRDPVALCDEILRRFPDTPDLLLVSRDDDFIHVLRSPRVEMCDPDDATEAGDTPTYVLPRDIIKSYLDMMEALA